AEYKSPYGLIISKWHWINKDFVNYEVTIPPNSSATLYLSPSVKGKKKAILQPGKHLFKLKANINL
ncbi:MAG TPA: hypothetical protein DCS09_05800, partial [Porphyromonadaceae bacterium]|nr:hypothetical protein [Porphyromonadaceae bacterium]HBB00002.1 hypothetical protein [Porphyromonadaceae bacterium]HCC17908.1 hypothetical protein [Porphyromonadaceae bacterium]